MMYQDKIVTAIKVNGKILRESGDTVTLPFGCEYSVLLKNLNSVRALVSVSVDGKDATDGTKLIIPPNSSIELERFINNGNLHSGNRFKFIERTKGIEDHRGIGSDDGLIRVEAWREHIRPEQIVPNSYYTWPWPSPTYPHYPQRPTLGPLMKSASPLRSNSFRSFDSVDDSSFGTSNVAQASCSLNMVEQEVERGDAGITVAGSQSTQRFYSTSGFETEPQSAVVVLRLRGKDGGAPVTKPAYVEVKPICSTCGKQNKPINQFCYKCGTSLTLI